MSIVLITPLFINSIVVITSTPQYIYYTDGTYYWRKGVRGYIFVIDKALTLNGFNGEEGTDWENVYNIN